MLECHTTWIETEHPALGECEGLDAFDVDAAGREYRQRGYHDRLDE
jgi:hypothetical protein